MLLSLTAQDLLEAQVTALIGSLWSHGGVWTQTLWPFKSRSGRLHLIHRDTRPDTHTQTPTASLPSADLSGQLTLYQSNTAGVQQQEQMPHRSTFVFVERESVRICVFLSA